MPSHKTATLNFQVRNRSLAFSYFNTEVGRKITEEILRGKTYRLLPKLSGVRCVVDIGANVGAATILFANAYPESRILAFEPAPDSFVLLQRNTEDIEGVEAYPIGLFNADRKATLYRGRKDTVTRSLAIGWGTTEAGDQVTLRDAAECLRELSVDRIDILKVDTEGAELHILSSITDLLANISIIYLEFHSEDDRRAIDTMLAPSHMLCVARIDEPHRGDLTYVVKRIVKSWHRIDEYKITI